MAHDNFDFQEYSEAPEKMDFSRTRECPHCKKAVSADATICYFCGEDFPPPGGKQSWVAISAAALAIIFIVMAVLGR